MGRLLVFLSLTMMQWLQGDAVILRRHVLEHLGGRQNVCDHLNYTHTHNFLLLLLAHLYLSKWRDKVKRCKLLTIGKSK